MVGLEYFKDIHLEPIKHIYTWHGETLSSVSKIKEKYKKDFNSDFWSQYKAKQLNMTQEEVLAMWDKNRLIGTTRGTAIHEYLEYIYTGQPLEVTLDPFVHTLDQLELDNYMFSLEVLKKFCDKFVDENPQLKPIGSEVQVGCKYYKIAGTFDQLFEVDGKVELWDWKTDSKFRTKSQYKTNMLPPIAHLEECEFNTYSIQLNIYKFLLEKYTDIEISKMVVTWFNHMEEDYKIIEIPNLQTEVKLILDDYKQSSIFN